MSDRRGWRKVLINLAWAIPLAAGLDLAVGWAGDHVSRSLYRGDTTIPVILADDSRKIDTLIVGGCRAALNIDSKILSTALGGTQVFNSGKTVEGLGNIEFTLDIGLSHHSPKLVVIVLDDGNLQESYEQDAEEATSKLPWLPLMSAARRVEFEAAYPIPWLDRISGFWRYRGEGRYLAASAMKAALHRRASMDDGYIPRPAEQNIEAAIQSDEAAMVRNREQSQTLSPHAEGAVSRMIAEVKAEGAQPVLVVAPMNRFRATDAVNDRQFEILTQLAHANGVSAIFYPDNNSRFAYTDLFWSDQAHMNRLGAEAFSHILGADLARLLAMPGNTVIRAGSAI